MYMRIMYNIFYKLTYVRLNIYINHQIAVM